MTLLTDERGRVFALDWTGCAHLMERLLREQHRRTQIIITDAEHGASEVRRRLEA